MLLAYVLDAVTAGGGFEQRQPERGSAGTEGFEQRQIVQGPPRRRPRSAGGQPQRAERCGARLWQSDDEVEHPVQDDPTSGERDRDAVVGPRHPARGEPGNQSGQIVGVERQRLGERRARRRRKRLDLAHLGVFPGGAQCIERVAQGVLDLAGVHQLAQQRVDQPGQHEPVAATVTSVHIAAAGLVVRAEQLARSEDERRRVLAARHDDVVGGILEPGAQAAGQPRIEAWAGSGVAPQLRQDLGARAAVHRSGSITRHGGPEQRTWCDKDHRCSVPTGCDIAPTP